MALFPNPLMLAQNAERLIDFPVDPDVVNEINVSLPDNSSMIEQWVDDTIKHDCDWDLYGVPWYMPTAKEVLRHKKGDCKAKTVLLASILDAKKINYSIHFSPIHWWINYQDKPMGEFEEKYESKKDIPINEILGIWYEDFWLPMPLIRKMLLFAWIPVFLAVRMSFKRSG